MFKLWETKNRSKWSSCAELTLFTRFLRFIKNINDKSIQNINKFIYQFIVWNMSYNKLFKILFFIVLIFALKFSIKYYFQLDMFDTSFAEEKKDMQTQTPVVQLTWLQVLFIASLVVITGGVLLKWGILIHQEINNLNNDLQQFGNEVDRAFDIIQKQFDYSKESIDICEAKVKARDDLLMAIIERLKINQK